MTEELQVLSAFLGKGCNGRFFAVYYIRIVHVCQTKQGIFYLQWRAAGRYLCEPNNVREEYGTFGEEFCDNIFILLQLLSNRFWDHLIQ